MPSLETGGEGEQTGPALVNSAPPPPLLLLPKQKKVAPFGCEQLGAEGDKASPTLMALIFWPGRAGRAGRGGGRGPGATGPVFPQVPRRPLVGRPCPAPRPFSRCPRPLCSRNECPAINPPWSGRPAIATTPWRTTPGRFIPRRAAGEGRPVSAPRSAGRNGQVYPGKHSVFTFITTSLLKRADPAFLGRRPLTRAPARPLSISARG